MIRLTLRALSLYGKKITNSLKASEHSLNVKCSCPPGQSCSVEVNELPGRRFEVIVTRPGTVLEDQGWALMTSRATGKYRRLFDKRTNVGRIRDSVARIVGAPLNDLHVAADTPDAQDIRLVDTAILQTLEKLIVGCQTCSPFADVPFNDVLDRATRFASSRTYYMLEEDANCPRCRRKVTEETLVELDVTP